MTLKIAPHPPTRAQRGFTLIELMIALVVVGVLLAIALPSFMDSVRKGRRAEAFAALTQVQAAQERWRANNPTYANGTQIFEDKIAVPPRQGLPVKTGYYTMAITGPSATGYTVTATAISDKSQTSDTNCQVLGVRMDKGNIEYGSGASAAAFPDASRCWAR